MAMPLYQIRKNQENNQKWQCPSTKLGKYYQIKKKYYQIRKNSAVSKKSKNFGVVNKKSKKFGGLDRKNWKNFKPKKKKFFSSPRFYFLWSISPLNHIRMLKNMISTSKKTQKFFHKFPLKNFSSPKKKIFFQVPDFTFYDRYRL